MLKKETEEFQAKIAFDGGAPRTNMKRGITVLVSLSVLVTVAYFTASKWAIRHETIVVP